MLVTYIGGTIGHSCPPRIIERIR